jgi:hypothetical protein
MRLLKAFMISSCFAAAAACSAAGNVPIDRPSDDVNEGAPSSQPSDSAAHAPATSPLTNAAPEWTPPAERKSGPVATCTDTVPEPGALERDALQLEAIDDCDGDGGKIHGVSNGTLDVDMYKFRGNDTPLCRIDPLATNHTPGIRLCMFAQCVAGATNVSACTTGTRATSRTGLPGCCIDYPGDLAFAFDCGGSFDDTADYYLRVDQPDSNKCLPYDVSYSL